jgi:hypothetical protein
VKRNDVSWCRKGNGAVRAGEANEFFIFVADAISEASGDPCQLLRQLPFQTRNLERG